MEDEPSTSPPTPSPPSEIENTEAEDTTPQEAPAEPAEDPDEDPDEEGSGAAIEAPPDDDAAAPREETQPVASHDLPRTSTTGDDEVDLRTAGDGAISGAPGDDLDDSAQRHD
jgi:hypothetical protein